MLRKGSASKVRTKKAREKEIEDHLFIGTLGIDCVEYSRACYESVVSDARRVKFCYMDNGSEGVSIEAIKAWKDNNPDVDEFEVVWNGENVGVGPGWNKLIKMAIAWGATKILICNNDIRFGTHTLDGLCTAFDKLREEIPSTVMVTAANMTKNPDELKNIHQEWVYHEHPDFSCFMITPETIERCGWLSEDYLPGYYEDNDYHHRLLLSGWKAWGTNWAPYCHIASRTRYAHPNIVSHQQFRDNRQKFYDRFCVTGPDQEIEDRRREAFLEAHEHVAGFLEVHPENADAHPAWGDVLEWAESNGIK